MAKIKLTKTELKQQRDALKQYTRFLPTLQLKKQQLQMEMRRCLERIAENEKREAESRQSLSSWIALFGDETVVYKVPEILCVRAVKTGSANVAGVEVPTYQGVDFEVKAYDLFAEEPWLDDVLDAVQSIVEFQTERDIIRRQYDCIARELRVTTQRVNLFEKIKIPETRENIRLINIAIGDADTSAVVRSKIVKKKLEGSAA